MFMASARTGPTSSLGVIHAKRTTGIPWLVSGFSTRHGGVSSVYGGKQLNIGVTQHDRQAAGEQNRNLLQKTLGAYTGRELWPLMPLRQIHSDTVHCVAGISS